MSKVLYQADLDLSPVRERTVAIIGYGNHGRSHALNLRDMGVEQILVALREGSASRETARTDGFEVVSIADAARQADILALMAADEVHGEIWREHLLPHCRAGQVLILAHGFSIDYGVVDPPADIDVVLAAPKGPGGAVRSSFERGGSLIGFWAVHQDASGQAEAIATAYLGGLGCGRAGLYPTSFKEEALADILGEQAVLVGGICALARVGYEQLVASGINPIMAYIDTVHELKYITDLIHERGIAGMYAAISDTAEFGAHEVEDSIRTAVRPVFEAIIRDVTAGDFARRWVTDYERGRKHLYAMRAKATAHPLERTGRLIRSADARRKEPLAWL